MPKLIFQDQHSEFTEEDGPVLVGSGKNCQIILPASDDVAPEHFEIFFDGERWKVKNLSKLPLRTNGGGVIPPGQLNSLREQSLFAFGENCFVAYHGESAVKFHPVTSKDPQQNEKDLLVSKFYAKVNTDQIEKYLAYFVGKNFRVSSVYVLIKEGTHWNKVAEHSSSAVRYKPSLTLLRQFAATGGPVHFDISGDEESPHSIVKAKIKKAFLIPLVVGGQIEGALYVDSDEEILNEKDFYKIQHLCENGVAALIKARRLGARMDYPIRDKLPKMPFQARLLVRNFPNLALSVKVMENEHRFLISAPEDPKQAVIVKIFQDGLLAPPIENEPDESFFSDVINSKFKIPACDLAVQLKSRKLTCWVNRTEKFFTGLRKEGIISEFNLLVGETEIKADEALLLSPAPSLVHDFLEISQ